MALARVCLAAFLARGAAQEEGLTLFQASVGVRGDTLAVVETFSAGASWGQDAPEWCKNDTQLTWKQRKERMQQHATLEWAKKQVAKMREENTTIPEWMDKIVTDDENRGKLKWAVQESKRLKAEDKEVPSWMNDMVAEDMKWSYRWAACKASELKVKGEEVPEWMTENARKGIMDYAKQKADEIQEQIDQLDEEKDKEELLVEAKGDLEVAHQVALHRAEQTKSATATHQLATLEAALARFEQAEEELKRGECRPAKVTQAMARTRVASETMSRLLERKLAVIQSTIESVV